MVPGCEISNFPINGSLLHMKGDELSSWMDFDFKCSGGWLSQFKSRHNISYQTICGQSSDVYEDIWTNFGMKLLMCWRICLMWTKLIFFFFFFNKLLPKETLCFKEDACIRGKSTRQRISAGKSVNPQC